MIALRSRHWLAASLAAVITAALAAAPALAGSPYSLHVKISGSQSGRALDLSVPWDLDRGSSPFDFTDDGDNGPGVVRLREAWAKLSHMPDRKPVIIDGEHRPVRAWRDAGALVLEPQDEDDRGTLIRIPGEIVELVLRRDGRLKSDDLGELLRGRREMALVSVLSNHGQVKVWIDRDEDDDEE